MVLISFKVLNRKKKQITLDQEFVVEEDWSQRPVVNAEETQLIKHQGRLQLTL